MHFREVLVTPEREESNYAVGTPELANYEPIIMPIFPAKRPAREHVKLLKAISPKFRIIHHVSAARDFSHYLLTTRLLPVRARVFRGRNPEDKLKETFRLHLFYSQRFNYLIRG